MKETRESSKCSEESSKGQYSVIQTMKSFSQFPTRIQHEKLSYKEKRKSYKRRRERELFKLTGEVATLENEQTEYLRWLQLFQGEYGRARFKYEFVIKRGQCFYMTGLTESEFDCLFECLDYPQFR